ncbi:MAG: hypothetical protein QOD02_1025, partial [Mycobacterium sp.]|nr:hypothetical protein [Mycobacterium sp.]
GRSASGGRLLLRLAIISKPWLPASAQECAASATIDADPDSTAAAVLASAIAKLTATAINTVRTLSVLAIPLVCVP